LTVFYLAMFVASVLFSFILTRYMRDWAIVRGWVAGPGLDRGMDRHLHSRPLPRLGGVAIFLTFLVTIGIAWLISCCILT
jgi:UDP-GlcNAc:undecaprenyl-phosphate/decaprenyl-phosphate GlcNAc-1-phosphate transferase